jgi:hypothetical protein
VKFSPTVFVKHYTDPARGVAAHAHLTWLTQLDSGIRLPHLHPGTASHLILEHLTGRPVTPADLPPLAATLGRLHRAAHQRALHTARLDKDFVTTTGLTIKNYCHGREDILIDAGLPLTTQPAALYKDSNLRNAILTTDGPALVDFDDLTLAPFGYDLAKLVVSTAMTHGTLPTNSVPDALIAYNAAVRDAGGPVGACTVPQLAAYAEMHDRLTAAYLGRNGYRHPWPTVRPWPQPRGYPPPVKEPPWPSPPNSSSPVTAKPPATSPASSAANTAAPV